jgi:hypothetical protein
VTTIRAAISGPALYLAWAAVSALTLTTAALIDPYIFAAVAFVAAGVSAVICLASILWSRPRLFWAAGSATPTVVSFVVLSTYHWG